MTDDSPTELVGDLTKRRLLEASRKAAKTQALNEIVGDRREDCDCVLLLEFLLCGP